MRFTQVIIAILASAPLLATALPTALDRRGGAGVEVAGTGDAIAAEPVSGRGVGAAGTGDAIASEPVSGRGVGVAGTGDAIASEPVVVGRD